MTANSIYSSLHWKEALAVDKQNKQDALGAQQRCEMCIGVAIKMLQ